MATPVELLTRLPPERFTQVINTAPKKVREELFRRAGIKNRGGAFALRTTQKTEARIRRLYEALLDGADFPSEIAEEVIRNYLYHRRDLLSEALDFLEVDHDNGLTDADLEFVTELETSRVEQLRELLLRNHAPEDVDLYLGFMGIPSP